MSTKTAVHRHRKVASHLKNRHPKKKQTWLTKHHVIIVRSLEVFAIFAAISVAVQMFYPPSSTLPLLKAGGIAVGAKNEEQLQQTLDWYGEHAEVTLKSPSREWAEKWQTIGIGIDREATAAVVRDYPVWERLIPFSSVVRIAQGQDLPIVTLVDEERLKSFATKLVEEDSQAAAGASLVVREGQVVIDPAKHGYQYTLESVQRQLKTAPLRVNGEITLVPQLIAPDEQQVQSELLHRAAEHGNNILQTSLTVIVAEQTFEPTAEQKGEWLVFSHNELEEPVVHLNNEKIQEFVQEINTRVGMSPETSTVHLLDGREISRTPAAGGQQIDVTDATNKIIEHLQSLNSQPLTLELVEVPPHLEFTEEFTETNAGLQALIEKWERSVYGNYGIIVRELGGEGRYAEWQPDQQFVTASTFKIFVYYAVAKKIEAGTVSYGDRTDMGWTVEACLQEMIVNSTNPCSVSLLNMVGWAEAQRMIEEAGFYSTILDNRSRGGDKYSTVRDETNFMHRLHDGTLMAQEPNERLLGYLKRQIWRGGIPSGVPRGVTVADKVGFYNGWVHDVAIVYSPGGTYLLGIMSKGGSDPVFAQLSRQVYNFFN